MSFRRAKQNNAPHSVDDRGATKISGIKPWINGGYLVSTGIRALDDLVGGGQGLGTVFAIESDSISSYGETILSYGIAQALSSSHRVLVITDCISSSEEISASLPYNQNFPAEAEDAKVLPPSKHKETTCTDEVAPLSDPAENSISGGDIVLRTETGLKIAWQYEKYVSKGELLALGDA